jgi:hypothetical protein
MLGHILQDWLASGAIRGEGAEGVLRAEETAVQLVASINEYWSSSRVSAIGWHAAQPAHSGSANNLQAARVWPDGAVLMLR